jgi:hypothetical protein
MNRTCSDGVRMKPTSGKMGILVVSDTQIWRDTSSGIDRGCKGYECEPN